MKKTTMKRKRKKAHSLKTSRPPIQPEIDWGDSAGVRCANYFIAPGEGVHQQAVRTSAYIGEVKKAIDARTNFIRVGDFIAFPSPYLSVDDKFPFYVAKVEIIREHSMYI